MQLRNRPNHDAQNHQDRHYQQEAVNEQDDHSGFSGNAEPQNGQNFMPVTTKQPPPQQPLTFHVPSDDCSMWRSFPLRRAAVASASSGQQNFIQPRPALAARAQCALPPAPL
jgi:hypothetical protein